ncbi:MAG: hypothetical protein IIU74_03800, partial [Ruminiclostridium sp.]|nr:hypothetical protein [Ruminiclostridium sp.]
MERLFSGKRMRPSPGDSAAWFRLMLALKKRKSSEIRRFRSFLELLGGFEPPTSSLPRVGVASHSGVGPKSIEKFRFFRNLRVVLFRSVKLSRPLFDCHYTRSTVQDTRPLDFIKHIFAHLFTSLY